MIWAGYNPYQQWIRQTRVTNPTLASANALSKQPQEFRVQYAATYGSNSSEQASSTFIRRFRYDPYARRVFVTIGNSQYWYNMGPRQLSLWLTQKSLGEYYNRFVKLKRK